MAGPGNDALFQLGMDLGLRSSTAQTEDQAENARPAAPHEAHSDFFCERNGERFAGTHLIVDLMGARRLDELAHVERTLRTCVDVAGATLLHIHLHHFTPGGGISGVAVLAESHISIHSWPERDYAAMDIFMCGGTDPHAALGVIERAFTPERMTVTEHLRGREAELCSAGSTRPCMRAGASA